MKYEYSIFNMSEAKDKEKWIDLLNKRGQAGWEVVFQLTKTSFLLKKGYKSV